MGALLSTHQRVSIFSLTLSMELIMLSDKIWITRKVRINTEKRLLKNASLSQVLMILYSSFLVFFSIWNLVHPNNDVNLLLVYGSIAVLILSIYLSSQKFIERALSMRNCYVQLDKIYNAVKRAEDSQDIKQIENYEAIYSDIILSVENHTDYDYLCMRHSIRKNDDTTLPNYTKLDFCHYILEEAFRLLIVLLSFCLPFIILFIWDILK